MATTSEKERELSEVRASKGLEQSDSNNKERSDELEELWMYNIYV